MRVVADDVDRGRAVARGLVARAAHCPPDRRQLAHLPRVLRAPHRPGHRVRAGHQRGVRVHVDAREHGQGANSPTPSRWPSTGPSRRSATSGCRRYKGTRDAAPDILRQQMGLVRQVLETLQIPILEAPGFEADDILATLATQGREAEGRRLSSSPATATPTSSSRTRTSGSLYIQRGVSELRGLRRGRHPRAHRRHPRAVPAVRGAARRPLRQPARRARGGGEDGRQADHHLRRPRRHLRAPRRADAEAPREPRGQRGQRAPEPRAHGARSATCRSTARSATSSGTRARSTSTRCGASSSSSSSTRCSIGWPRRSTPTWGPRRPRPRCSRRRSTSLDDAADGRQGARRPRRGDGPPLALAARVDRRRRPVRPRRPRARARRRQRRRRVAPGRAPRRRRRPRLRWAPWPARRSAPRRPRGQAARAARSPGSTSTCAAWRSTPRSPPTCSTPPRAATCSRSWSSATPAPGSPTATRPPRASSTSRARPRPAVDGHGPAGARRRSAGRRRCCAALDAQGLRALNDDIEVPLVGVLARMEDAGVAVDRDELAAAARPARRRRRAPPRRDRRGRRPRVQRELHAAAARGAVRRARPHAAEEDEDRLLHRRRQPREAGRPAPDHRAPARVPRGREAPLDLRRRAAPGGRPPTAASTPPSTRPSPAPAGCRRTSRTCTTSRCAPRSAASSARRSCPPTGASSWSPTTTRSSCAASPTWPRTRG